MKKIYILTAILAFAGITAYSLNSTGHGCETDSKKAVAAVAQSECGDESGAVAATRVNLKKTACCSSSAEAVNAVLTAGSEKAGCSGSSAVAVKTASTDCTPAVNAVLTAGSEKAGCSGSSAEAVKTASTDCTKAVNAELTAGSEKAGCCSSSDAAVQAVASEECSGEKNQATSIAENQ